MWHSKMHVIVVTKVESDLYGGIFRVQDIVSGKFCEVYISHDREGILVYHVFQRQMFMR